MKKWIVLGLLVLFWAGIADARPAKKDRTARVPKQQAAKQVEEPCKAFIVVEAATGKVLEEQNSHERRPPASVTKLMVAYIVADRLEKGQIKLTDQIVASKEASKIGGSQVYLKEGESFSLDDMMKAMLVASANDAAYAIAEHIAGSKEGFVQLMNEKAKALKMADTEFHSVHGLPPSKGERPDLTSASDLVLLARELLKYPKILEWTSIKSEGFRDGKFTLMNHNKLLIKMAGVDGFKTGYYRECGFNIVATGKKNEVRFIVAVLGSPSAKVRDAFVMEKMKKAYSMYKVVNVVKKGEIIEKDVFLDDGKYRKVRGVAKTDFSYPLPIDKKGVVKKEIALPERLKGEVKEGQKLGELIIRHENDVIGKVDIISPVYVPQANLFTRIVRRFGISI